MLLRCSVPDCLTGKRVVAFGYCGKHYGRWKKFGDPLGGVPKEQMRAKMRASSRRRWENTSEADKASAAAKRRATTLAKRILKVCVGCGEGFTVVPHEAAGRYYCSRDCFWSLERERRKTERKVALKCEFCADTFLAAPSHRRRFCSNGCRAQWQACLPYDQWRGKIAANVENRPRGSANPMWGKTSPHGRWQSYVRKSGETVRLRSTWELAVAIFLDKTGVAWEYEPARFDLRDRTYVPDFWLPTQRVYWEVKGWLHSRHAETIRQFREMHSATPLVVIGPGVIRGIAARAGVEVRL